VERVVRPRTDLSSRATSILKDVLPNKAVLKLHFKLKKAESSVLVQECISWIGLAKFLSLYT
jgi:hypothetical protein